MMRGFLPADRIVRAVLLLAVLVLTWQLRHVILLVLGAVVLAVALASFVRGLARVTKLPYRVSYVLALILITAIIAIGVMILGPTISSQASAFAAELPELRDQMEDALSRDGIVFPQVQEFSLAETLSRVPAAIVWIGSLISMLSGAMLVLVISWFLAFDPDKYIRSFSGLFRDEKRASRVVWASIDDLRGWIFGQFISMIIIGLVVGVGLWLIGVPYAALFGLIAGLLEFVPFVGPIVAYLPVGIITLTTNPLIFISVTIFFIVVQLLEGNLISPLVQRQTVSVEPAYQLVAILVGSALFGPLGVVFAVPGFVVVRAVWREVVKRS